MMDCKRLREVLDAYVDRELSADAMAQADTHIAECGACRRAVEGLGRLREAVRTAVGNPQPSPELSDRVRSLIAPRWYRATAVPAMAATLALALAMIFVPSVRCGTATALDYVSLKLDDSRPVVLEGKLLCRDCQLEKQYGYHAMCPLTGHHGWLATSDGRLWSILEGNASQDLIHNSSLLGREVRVQGRIFRRAGSIEVKTYQFL